MYLIWRRMREHFPPRLQKFKCYFLKIVDYECFFQDIVKIFLHFEELNQIGHLDVKKDVENFYGLQKQLILLRSNLVDHLQKELGPSLTVFKTPLLLGINIEKGNRVSFFWWKNDFRSYKASEA
jgi:hypothetical protein